MNFDLMMHFVGVTAGVVVAQVASLQEILGTDELWHYALSAYVILIVICFLPYTWFPESPKYLYIVAGKRDEARNGEWRKNVVKFIWAKNKNGKNRYQINVNPKKKHIKMIILNL